MKIGNMSFHALMSAFVLAAAVAFLSSCETWKDFSDSMEEADKPEQTPEYVLSVHEIVKYPRAQELEKEIPTFSGTNICINTNPFLHSRNIMKADILPSKEKLGFYDLQLHLDRRGRMMWIQIAVNFKGQQLALVVDGVFYRTFTPEQLDSESDSIVVIKGPFDQATASAILKYAPIDYKLFNKEN